jgi:pyrroline-5-carboxylate reductase
MDAVTAVSGSGPAYFYLLMEHMERAAVELGLSPELAAALTRETALGAARVVIETKAEPALACCILGSTTAAALGYSGRHLGSSSDSWQRQGPFGRTRPVRKGK